MARLPLRTCSSEFLKRLLDRRNDVLPARHFLNIGVVALRAVRAHDVFTNEREERFDVGTGTPIGPSITRDGSNDRLVKATPASMIADLREDRSKPLALRTLASAASRLSCLEAEAGSVIGTSSTDLRTSPERMGNGSDMPTNIGAAV